MKAREVDVSLLKELQSLGVASVQFNRGHIERVEFHVPREDPPKYEFRLPDGAPVDQAMLDAIEELRDADTKAFEERQKREELLYHSS